MDDTTRETADARYSRQALFAPLGPAGQERLGAARVLVIGCGALGSRSAEHLARAGVGFLRLVDRDVVEPSNLHRSGFTEEDARDALPKAAALAAHLRRFNSTVVCEPALRDFDAAGARFLASGMDLILDGTDNLPARFLINDLCLATGIPWIYCGAVGETGHAQVFVPGAGPCLRCLLPGLPPPGELPTCDTAGVIGPAPAAIAAIQAAMALRCLAGGPGAARALAGRRVRIAVWTGEYVLSEVPRDPGCPACAAGKLEFLDGGRGEEATVLCGRGAVQVRPARAGPIDLKALAARLRPLGTVDEKEHVVRFRSAEACFTVFADGRAIVECADRDRALAMYARFIGS